jgi:hypothetical protein
MLRGTLAEKSAGVEKGRATEVIARQVGFSHDLVEMAIWLMENAPEEKLEKPGNPSADFSANGKERAN